MNVGGKKPSVTAAMMRISMLSLRVRSATFLESSEIDLMTELSCRLNSASLCVSASISKGVLRSSVSSMVPCIPVCNCILSNSRRREAV
jgi:hypothetical protein